MKDAPRRAARTFDVDGRGSSAARTAVRVAAGRVRVAGVALRRRLRSLRGAAAFGRSDDRATRREPRGPLGHRLRPRGRLGVQPADGKYGAWARRAAYPGLPPRRPPSRRPPRRDARGRSRVFGAPPRYPRRSLLVSRSGTARRTSTRCRLLFRPSGTGTGTSRGSPVSRGTERVSASRASGARDRRSTPRLGGRAGRRRKRSARRRFRRVVR